MEKKAVIPNLKLVVNAGITMVGLGATLVCFKGLYNTFQDQMGWMDTAINGVLGTVVGSVTYLHGSSLMNNLKNRYNRLL